MSVFNKGIWEIAEGYVAGTLHEAELAELNSRIDTDTAFANEFAESTNLLRSFEGSGKQKRFRAMLRDIQQQQTVKKETKKVKLIALPAHFWRTAAVAAGVALLTSTITYSILNPSIRKSEAQYNNISRVVMDSKKVQSQQQAQLNQLIQKVNKNLPAPPAADAKYTGTGFALSNDGYFITAYHVINDGNGDFDSVYIQNHDGQYFKAFLVNFNAKSDVAILKVEKKNFHFGKGELPYTFSEDKAELGTDIFTLGYPKDDIVYSKGYISSRNGYNSNDQQYTLQLPAGHGQSGSPVLDPSGNVVGILTAISSATEANTYAVSANAVTELLHTIPSDNTIHMPKANKLSKLSRNEQVEKIEQYTFSVKVYKK